MSWSDTPDILHQFQAALSAYDWSTTDRLCLDLTRRLLTEADVFPGKPAKDLMGALRKKRRFDQMVRCGEAFIRAGVTLPRVRYQYAQALVDQGILIAPERILEELAGQTPAEEGSQAFEARGLLGRIYKQSYVNADSPRSPAMRRCFERALSEYLLAYRLDPVKNTWHGINVVALLHRAKADGLPLDSTPDADATARNILRDLPAMSPTSYAFDLATRVECFVALRDYKEAERAALEYSLNREADTFEYSSTLRQFVEVWRLRDDSVPGSTLLPILRAAKLRGEGGAEPAPCGPRAAEELQTVKAAHGTLQKRFGDDKTVTLKWYLDGLERSKSVAHIEREDGKGFGTGWLVKAGDFFPDRDPNQVLLLTNWHVVNATGAGGALTPDLVQAHFEGINTTVTLEDHVVWASPLERCDAVFLVPKQPLPAPPLPVRSKKVTLMVPPQRVYIIGYPGGRKLEFGLHDNHLIDCNDKLLHYRTPSEAGSSGSPVFDDVAWAVVGLHHAGGELPRLNGEPPPYLANEAIAISALQDETKRAGG